MQRFLVVVLILCAVALFYGYKHFLPQTIHPPTVAIWRDFDSPGRLEVTIRPTELSVTKDGKETALLHGVWTNRQFTADLPEGEKAAIARELSDESLELKLSTIFPNETRTATLTKFFHGWNDETHYPTYESFVPVHYPPPKGIFPIGMLECDLMFIPWHTGGVDVMGHDSEIGPNLWHFHSDDPKLPELLVTVYKGKVIKVTGGRENTDDPPAINQIPPPGKTSGATRAIDDGWVAWLFDVVFGK